jgi:L-aspartate oxidase
MQILDFDTIVVGSGLAGLTAAYYSTRYGKVAIVTKSELDTSNSYYAQGGIAGALSSDDSPQNHFNDTIIAGRELCDEDAVEILVSEGAERIRELIDLGMKFDSKGGKLIFGLEGGHSKRRILHADGDATGKMLTLFMLGKVMQEKNIRAFEYTAVVQLLGDNDRVTGIQAIDFLTGENVIFRGRSVVIATGGLSRLYTRTTNPHTATGDGITLAYEIGARIADIEFIQFHPTALMIPGKDAFLISEAVRGEGAWLLNENGKRFMVDIHPQAELAPRDVVAYAIHTQIRNSKSGTVYLSLKHLDQQKIKRRFHNIYKVLLDLGYDMMNDLLPVAPAAHYMVGGIRTGLNGETNIKGLFACGEAASTGVMGANRLASNSLTECLVFGKRASEMASGIDKPKYMDFNVKPFSVNAETDDLYIQYKNEIAQLMTNNVGVVRSKETLEFALARFSEILHQYSETGNDYNLFKIKNAATVGMLIAKGALYREESRGGHIRDDFKNLNPEFKAHLIQKTGEKIIFEQVRNKK